MKKIEHDYKILNINYGYLIEQMDNGLFQLKYQVKWEGGYFHPFFALSMQLVSPIGQKKNRLATFYLAKRYYI